MEIKDTVEVEAPQGADEVTEVQETQVDPVEALAREKGWRPKDEFAGDTDDFVEPADYLKQLPLKNKIKNQKRDIKRLERDLANVVMFHKQNVEAAKKQAIADLMVARDDAIESGRIKDVKEIEQRMQQVANMPEPPAVKSPEDEEFQTFIASNASWFKVDKEMTRDAIEYNELYLKRNPGKIKESLDETLRFIKKAYPEKFVSQRAAAPSAVETGSKVPAKTSKFDVKDLTADERLTYNQYVKVHKIMTHDEFFKSLAAIGG
jgi:hypothetical protein